MYFLQVTENSIVFGRELVNCEVHLHSNFYANSQEFASNLVLMFKRGGLGCPSKLCNPCKSYRVPRKLTSGALVEPAVPGSKPVSKKLVNTVK